MGLGSSSCGKQAASHSPAAAKAAMPVQQELAAKLCAQPAAAGLTSVRTDVPGTGGAGVVTAEVKSCSRKAEDRRRSLNEPSNQAWSDLEIQLGWSLYPLSPQPAPLSASSR